jgi:hypothetical protein
MCGLREDSRSGGAQGDKFEDCAFSQGSLQTRQYEETHAECSFFKMDYLPRLNLYGSNQIAYEANYIVDTMDSHMNQVFSEPRIETRFVNLIINTMHSNDEIETCEKAKEMFGVPIDGTDTGGASRFPHHHVVRVHQKKFETIQQMVAIGTSFRSVIHLSQIMRRMTNAEWLRGINSDMVQQYVRIVCVLNLQTLSGLMKHAWTYSIATDV